jgi:hypothetical protein
MKILLEIEFNPQEYDAKLMAQIVKNSVADYTADSSITIKRYLNVDELTVDSASVQCRKCPAYFVQEG